MIGAAARNSDVAADPAVRTRYPAVAQALLAGASGQIRNMATVGGNLLQRTRCPYFQDVASACNKREPGSGCPARTGEHRGLAVLGASPACIATHPSDFAVALTALDATVRVTGPAGERSIAISALYPSGTDAPARDTVLERADVITAVELPPLPSARGSRYRKVRDRASFAFALVSLAAVLETRDGMVQEARIAFGGLAPRPWRAARAEAALAARPGDRGRVQPRRSRSSSPRPSRSPATPSRSPLAGRLLTRTLVELSA